MEAILNITDMSSVSDLIRFLYHSFAEHDYSKVQTILTNRENAFKTELEILRQDNKNLKKKYELAELARIKETEELRKSKGEYDKLKLKFVTLDENFIELNEKIKALEGEKLKKEEELEEYKRRFHELDKRVLKMEEKLKKNCYKTRDFGEVSPNMECSVIEVSQQANNEILSLEAKEGSHPTDLASGVARKRHTSESEVKERYHLRTKRKTEHVCEIGTTPNATKRDLQEPCNRVNESSTEGVSDVKGIAEIQKDRENTWMCAADMLSALTNDPQLCMDAICALYRQEILVKTTQTSSPFKKEGVGLLDIARGVEVVKYLINDYPEYQLSKSLSEVQEMNPTMLPDCKKLAIYYYEQLFEIYQKKLDRFFCQK